MAWLLPICLGLLGSPARSSEELPTNPHQWFFDRFGEGTGMETFKWESAGISSTEFNWILDRAEVGQGGPISQAVISLYEQLNFPTAGRSLNGFRSRILEPAFVARFVDRDRLFGPKPVLPRSWFTPSHVDTIVRLARGMSVPLFQSLPRERRDDVNYVLAALSQSQDPPGLVHCLSRKLQENRVILERLKALAMTALGRLGDPTSYLSSLPNALLDDREVIGLAVSHTPGCLLQASARLQHDQALIRTAIEADPTVFIRLPPDVQDADRTYRRFGGYVRERWLGMMDGHPRRFVAGKTEVPESGPEIVAAKAVPSMGGVMLVDAAGKLVLWNGKAQSTLLRTLDGGSPVAEFSGTGDRLAIRTGSGSVVAYETGRIRDDRGSVIVENHGNAMAWSSDGSRLAVSLEDGKVLFWSATGGGDSLTLEASRAGSPAWLAWSDSGAVLFAGYGDMAIWALGRNRTPVELRPPSAGQQDPARVGFSALMPMSTGLDEFVAVERLVFPDMEPSPMVALTLMVGSTGTVLWGSDPFGWGFATCVSRPRAHGFLLVGGSTNVDSPYPDAAPWLWLWRIGSGGGCSARIRLTGGAPTAITPGVASGTWIAGTSRGEVLVLRVILPVAMTPADVERCGRQRVPDTFQTGM